MSTNQTPNSDAKQHHDKKPDKADWQLRSASLPAGYAERLENNI